jgi:DNA-directed RNA polymerase subunit RPC12/RpoP
MKEKMEVICPRCKGTGVDPDMFLEDPFTWEPNPQECEDCRIKRLYHEEK